MELKNIFLILFILIYTNLGLCNLLSMRDKSILGLSLIAIMQIINIGVAYHITELILSIFLCKNDLLRIDILKSYPNVALLYVSYNDILQESLLRLKYQNYPNYDIFILDDSTYESCKKKVDDSNFTVIRRTDRKGFKAGAINNWLKIHGKDHKYFIILDSDSIIERDFIESMVKYAEHGANRDVAIFQSNIINWNDRTTFARILSCTIPFQYYINNKILNKCEYIVSWGHNNLHRTDIFFKIGGFDENFVAEDLAIGIKILRNGYKCKLVDVTSYDMTPETLQRFSKRQIRWAKQNIDLLKLNTIGIELISKIHLYMSIYQYLIWIVFFISIIIIVFSYNSSFEDIPKFIKQILEGKMFNSDMLIQSSLWTFYMIIFTVIRLPFALKLGISVADYFKNLTLLIAVSYIIMPYLIIEQLKTILGEKTTFDVTEKTRTRMHSSNGFSGQFPLSIAFIVLIIIGIIRNPLALILNFLWLFPLILSPFIIHAWSKDNYVHHKSQE